MSTVTISTDKGSVSLRTSVAAIIEVVSAVLFVAIGFFIAKAI